MKNCELNY